MSTKRTKRVLQKKFTRILLTIATLVAISIAVASVAKVMLTITSTELQLWSISDGIKYYEEERGFALQTSRGQYATECDQKITMLYEERNTLANSEDDLVRFTVSHRWPCAGIILAFVSLVCVFIVFFVKHLYAFLSVFMKVIDVEEFIVRMLVAGVSFVVWVVLASIAKSSYTIWNQTKPRKKVQQNCDNASSKVINIRTGKRGA